MKLMKTKKKSLAVLPATQGAVELYFDRSDSYPERDTQYVFLV